MLGRLSFGLGMVLGGVLLLHAPGATKPLTDRSVEAVKFCVNQLLYTQTFKDGAPAGQRTIVAVESAAIACRGVQSSEEAVRVKRCVNELLYTDTFNNGSPAGKRTLIDEAAATKACSRCRSSL